MFECEPHQHQDLNTRKMMEKSETEMEDSACHILVYELTKDHSKEMIYNEMSKYGSIQSVHVKRNKTQQLMGFVTVANKCDCAAVIANLNQKPPFHWSIRLNEPMAVRTHRNLAKQGRAHEAQVTPESQAEIAEFCRHEAEINELVRQLSVGVQLRGGGGVSPAARPSGPQAGGAHDGQQAEPGVVYDARLLGRTQRPCSICGTPTVSHCKRCKVRYCSRACQIQDWDMHILDCREPELPELVVTAGGDGPALQRGGGRGAHRGRGYLAHPANDHLARVERPAGGRGAQRGRGDRRLRGSPRGGDGDGQLWGTDVEDMSPGRKPPLLGSTPRSPATGTVSAAIQPLEAPAKPVLAQLAERPAAVSAGLPSTPPRAGRTNVARPAARRTSPRAAPATGAAAGQRTPPSAAPATGAAIGQKTPPPAAAARVPPSVSAVTLEPGHTYQVAVSFVEDPATVYLRLQQKLAATDKMEVQLQQQVAAGPGVSPPPVGHLCAAQFEGVWYRGEVLASAGGQYRVCFVDWGNTEQLPAAAVLPLPARFADWPRQAVRARLSWRPAAGGWSGAQRAAAAALLQRLVTARVTGRQQGAVTVTLTDDGGRDLLADARERAAPAPAAARAAHPSPTPGTSAAAAVPAAAASAVPAAPVVPGTTPGAVTTVTGAPSAAAAAAPAASLAVSAVSLLDRLPDNLSPLLSSSGPLEVAPSVPLDDSLEMAVVVLNEEFIELAEELESLPAQPTVSASTGDLVVASEQGTPSRALVCGTGPHGLKLLFVDTGSVAVSTEPVRPLPARWTLSRFAPVALRLRMAPGASADARDALLGEENMVTLKLQPGSGGERAAAVASTVAGLSVPVTVSSCRALLGQVAGCAPDLFPAPREAQGAAVRGGVALVSYAPLESGRQHIVLPCAMEHPQRVSAQLQDPAHYQPYLKMETELQHACNSARAPPAPPADGSLLAVHCEAVGCPAAWRRAVLLDSSGGRLRLRLIDWAVTVEAQLSDVRSLDSSFAQERAIGVEFGLAGIGEDACPEGELPFYRKKLLNCQFLLEQAGELRGVPQAVLNLLSDEKSFCFNDKMRARLAMGSVQSDASRAVPPPAAAAAATADSRRAATPAALTPAAGPTSVPATTSTPAPAAALAPAVAPVSVAPPAPVPALFANDLPKMNLKPGEKIPFVVTEVLSATNMFGSPLTDAAVEAVTELDELLLQLGDRAPPLSKPQLEQLLLAPAAANDGGWSRGSLLDLDGDTAHVWMVDHGCLEEVPAAKLRLLHPSLARFAAGAVDLTLAGYDRLDGEHATLAQQTLTAAVAQPLLLEVVSSTEDGFLVRSSELETRLRAAGAPL